MTGSTGTRSDVTREFAKALSSLTSCQLPQLDADQSAWRNVSPGLSGTELLRHFNIAFEKILSRLDFDEGTMAALRLGRNMFVQSGGLDQLGIDSEVLPSPIRADTLKEWRLSTKTYLASPGLSNKLAPHCHEAVREFLSGDLNVRTPDDRASLVKERPLVDEHTRSQLSAAAYALAFGEAQSLDAAQQSHERLDKLAEFVRTRR